MDEIVPVESAVTTCFSRATGSDASGSPPCALIIARHLSIALPSFSACSGSFPPRIPAASSISRANTIVSSTTSLGPPPASTSIDSRTSRALPAVNPSGTSIAVTRARVFTPALVPSDTIVRANSSARLGSDINAPLPVFTSKTNALVPSAIFFDMIDDAINGIASTVAVTSRRAYNFLSAGASPAPAAQITAPTSLNTRSISSLVNDARHPGIDSNLSSVPPVWPNPRPDNCGTAAPHAATRGASGRVILSPTPPVECLSTVGIFNWFHDIRSPLLIIASVQREISRPFIPLSKIAIRSADICSSATTPRV